MQDCFVNIEKHRNALYAGPSCVWPLQLYAHRPVISKKNTKMHYMQNGPANNLSSYTQDSNLMNPKPNHNPNWNSGM